MGPGAADRLVVVEHAEQVRVVATELGKDRPARQGRVLELVDHRETEAARDLAPHVGALGQQASQGERDVARVKAPGRREYPVVRGVELGELELAAGALPRPPLRGPA